MLKDITLGQYFPIDSKLHKLDSRTKILMLLLNIVLIFTAKTVLLLPFLPKNAKKPTQNYMK